MGQNKIINILSLFLYLCSWRRFCPLQGPVQGLVHCQFSYKICNLPFLSFLSYLFHTEFNSKEFISYILVFIGFLCPVISSLDTIYLLIIGTKTYIISFIFLELYFSFKSKFISRFISRFYFILSFSLWYQDLSLGSHLTFSRLLFHKDNYRHLPQFLDIFCYL